jgi:hypothetical protein
MLGIIQEQHPDRCALFMQWKQMGWPILVDALNLLEVPYVPITLSLDEHGVIRQIHGPLADAKTLEEEFVDRTFDPMSFDEPAARPGEPGEAPVAADPAVLRSHADQVLLWGGQERLGEVIDAYAGTLATEPDHAYTLFRLGVAYRMRYDSDHRETQDFQHAITSWDMALQRDPNNYIWRRRLQQYGPRLDKPYPFYDWVSEARREIEAHGETPVPLQVEPQGAELAEKSGFEASADDGGDPDPDGRLLRDRGTFVQVQTAVVPPAVTPGHTVRVHLRLQPNQESNAHWNNEVEELSVWLSPPEGWEVTERELKYPNPQIEVSTEARSLEFEIKAPPVVGAGAVLLPAYALYYVCEEAEGVCLYRRQGIDIRIPIRDEAP